jgi:hypothetical protein
MQGWRMPKLCFSGSACLRTINHIAILCLALCSCAHGQQSYPSLEEVHVSNVPKLMARSHDPLDVLLTSLDTVLHDREVCCGTDSALEDSAQRADPASMEDIAAKLRGRHLLSDGRPIMVTAQYVPPDAINGYLLIETLQQKHALLMSWQSHLYVCYGVTYRKDSDTNGGVMDTILTFQLIDTRYSDSRREVVFNRETDDWKKVQGLLWVAVAPQ